MSSLNVSFFFLSSLSIWSELFRQTKREEKLIKFHRDRGNAFIARCRPPSASDRCQVSRNFPTFDFLSPSSSSHEFGSSLCELELQQNFSLLLFFQDFLATFSKNWILLSIFQNFSIPFRPNNNSLKTKIGLVLWEKRRENLFEILVEIECLLHEICRPLKRLDQCYNSPKSN